MPLELAIAGLSKTYPNGVQALREITLTIPTGMYGLLGPNGAGKSTLMRTLATLQEADAGSARLVTTPTLAADAASLPPKGEQFAPWDGPAARIATPTIDVLRDKEAVRARLGYLPQDFGVYPKVSAQDLLDHLARLKGITRAAERRDVVQTLLKQVNLLDVRKKALGGFSGGMRQRFGIAQALLGNPELVIVDEPTAGLDPEERVRFHNLLAEIGENVIVILSTHIVSDVSDLCANMAIIDRGEVLLTGAPQTLTDTLAHRVWQKAVAREDLEAAKATFPVIATRLAGGARSSPRSPTPHRGRASRRSSRCSKMSISQRSPAACAHRSRSPRKGTRMHAFLTIAWFEARSRLKRLSTWVYFAVFLALSMLWTAAAGGVFADANIIFGSGKVWINSPYAIAQTIAVLGMIGVTVAAALAGRAVQQDVEYRTEHFFFTAPIQKWQYLGGRYAGAVVVLMLIFTSIAIGGFIGTLVPGVDPDRLGPPRFAAYAVPYLTVLLPNLLWLSGLFFCAAALTRRMLPVYIGSVLCIIGYLVGSGLLRDIEYKSLAATLDPFGVLAMARLTEYWPIAERNARLLPFEGLLLWNRVLWLCVGGAFLALCFHRFRFAYGAGGGRRAAVIDVELPATPTLRLRRVTVSPVNGLALLPRLAWLYFRETVKNVYFGVIVLAGVLFLAVTSTTLGSAFGTTTWPVTYQIQELVSGTFSIFMLVIITFYAGELVWRERDNRFDQINDALPIPTWLSLTAKLAALMLIPSVLQAVLLVCGVAIQTIKGYTHYELGLYVRDLFDIDLVNYWFLCVLAITVHSIVNQKYAGHFVMIVYFVALLFADALGFEHNLYKYGAIIPYTYSDMNGYGHFMARLRTFQAYYAAWAVLLAVLAFLFWTRGTTTGWRERVVVLRSRLTPRVAATTGVAALAAVALGGYIFYNTNILNRYLTARDGQARQANYEKKYKPLEMVPQPKVTAVKLTVDLYPREQRVRMRGTFALANKNDRPIEFVHLFFLQGEKLLFNKLEFATPATLAKEDLPVGLKSYQLATPLPPGGTARLDFDLEVPTHGFENSGSNTQVVYNGTFVNGGFVLPFVGYSTRGELSSDRDRKKFGLAPKERMRDRDDPAGLAYNYIGHDADWISFDAEVVTDDDQIAIAPGYLQKEWTENGRRHFVYTMDAPILDFFAFQSARYAVKKDRWNDVAIEVYYQPGHEYNLDRMIASVKASLDYYTANFGPYQHKQFRILEFPRYEVFAQSFPNTIPYSEAIGFIARVREGDKDDIDYPYYVTAHEAAHQWWAHQVIGGDVQGSTMLSETLAQYSALMVMKRKYGEAKMQRFLSYELDRYLIGRSTEQKKELPLGRVENQPYVHYRKGSLVMYALADYIGEDNLNRAIRAFRDEWAYKGPPYPNATQFLQHVRAVTPPQYQYVIDDMFESITLYDNRATAASAKVLPGGKYEVTIKTLAKKRKADDLGRETDVPVDDWIDIGVLDADGAPLFLEKKKIQREENEFTVIVDKKPARAGIDPLNKLIDRRPKDNTVAIELP